jgi:hypothetical protein
MSRYPGRVLSSTAPTVSANSAKGIWTLDEAMRYIRAGQWPVPTGNGDPYFQYNTMLLPGQGTNGAQNNTFLDSSTNNFTITRNGNTTQGTFTPFSGAEGNWSNYFAGSQSISAAASTDFQFAGDFTIESWIYPTTTGADNFFIQNSGSNYFAVNVNAGTGFEVFLNSSTPTFSPTDIVPPLNQWSHIALVRSGSTVKIYLNGVASTTTSTNSSTVGYNAIFYVGAFGTSSTGPFVGYASNFRAVNGNAVYTTNFTPPTSPLSAITNTKLLTCQSNRFIDNSSGAKAITTNGTPQVTPFQPFGAPTSAYSASTIGGSGYFDGTGDYLDAGAQTAFAFGTGSWTVEAWVYVNSLASEILLFDTRSSASTAGVGCRIATDGTLSYSGSANNALTTSAIKVNEWNHIAWSYDGTTLSGYINGSRGGTATPSFNISQNNGVVGRVGFSAAGYMNGYIGGLRVVKGTAVYSGTSFTVPTAPLTAITNTSLLLNYTNAGIIDNAQDNNLETVGNAQISTTQYKWGASSMYFDGTGDWLFVPTSQNYVMGTGDFTVEMWLRTDVIPSGTYDTVFDTRPASTNGAYLLLYLDTDGKLKLFVSSADRITASSALAINTWYHVVVARTGGSTKMFINGNQTGSTYADTTNYIASNLIIGGSYGGGASIAYAFNGYMNDFRITKGYARYLYPFTAPTAALPLFYQAAATPSSDPYFDYTTLLLPGNGTNGAQNNTFLDSSTNAFTITRNGNTTQGTFTPFSQTGWSNNFNGSSTFSAASNSAFNILAYDTFECWVNMSVLGTSDLIAGRDGNYWLGYNHTSINGAANKFVFAIWNGSSWQAVSSATTPSVGLWYHVMGVKDNTTLRIYINGVQENTASFSGTPITTGTFYVASNNNTENLEGYVSNLRLVTGASSTVFPYSGLTTGSSFSVPTSSLTAVTGTALLTCQSNRFVDNSTNAFALTVAGSPTVQAFSPFNPTAAYSTSTVGGSGYFDGTGDFLSVTNNAAFNFGSAAFTIEFWYYPTTLSGTQCLITNYGGSTTGFVIQMGGSTAGSGKIDAGFSGDGADITSTNAVKLNSWNHIAISGTPGATGIKLFINGAQEGSTYTGATSLDTSSTLLIGEVASTNRLSGYLSGLRLLKGTAQYTTTFTPPTAPPTAITNTSLLLNYTNGGIIDNTAKNNLETVGNASISTTVSKFGGSSMYFDGTGDYLTFRSNPHFAFGTGDFTIEAWVYPTSTAAVKNVCGTRGATGSTTAWNWGILTDSSIQMYSNGNIANTGANSVPINTWTYVAFVRYGGTIYGFVNGVLRASTANTQDFTVTDFWVGATGGSIEPYLGYINDLRITKGIARYTQNFTPPTTAFLTL